MNKKWWHNKIAYQIYPKSFYDSNGDGIGDLRGIIEKLDYLKDLGIDLIWISPCYFSPMADQGYDIADYYRINPMFGTIEDMDELIAEAKKRGIGILMDLVVNHCSDEHEWFQKAWEDPTGPYASYFYIEKCKDGKLPCNWRSYFGGPVWEQIRDTDYYYLHVFHKKQPDLNWENENVRKEIYKMINWWLEKGIAGFRIDAIINIKKALPFKNYKVDRNDGLSDIGNMLADAHGVLDFLQELADETFRKYDAFTVGEVFNEKPEELPGFVGENGCFSSLFDFEKTIWGQSSKGTHKNLDITADAMRDCTFKSQRKLGENGFYSNIIENHDEPRGVSHYIKKEDVNDISKKMLAGVYFFLRGIPFIYQGQELGMENVPFSSIDEIDDIATIDQYRVALEDGLTEKEALEKVVRFSRDNARTPFQWDDSKQAGFTTGNPWLKVNPNYKNINAKSQEEDPHSVLSFYKEMIALRKCPEYEDIFVYGKLVPIWENKHNIFAYKRVLGEEEIYIIANYQKDEVLLDFDFENFEVLLNNYEEVSICGKQIKLHGYQILVMK